jgi:Response regulator containing a CheY-like receiver domain and an HTH DNA-binding domain
MFRKTQKISVMLVDSERMFLDTLKVALEAENNINVVGSATNGKNAVSQLKSKRPDIVILDTQMSKMGGIEIARVIKEEHPDTNLIILTRHKRRNDILLLMQIGVNGYLFKDRSIVDLVTAIHDVHKKRPHFAIEVLNIIANSKDKDSTQQSKLTLREIEILRSIAEGLTTKEIAKKLYISEPTVSTHRRNVLEKLGIKNTMHLIRYAIKHGYVEI